MTPQLTYFVLRCKDIEISRAWYEALGFDTKTEKHGDGPEHYSMQCGDIVIELYPVHPSLIKLLGTMSWIPKDIRDTAVSTSSGIRMGLRVPNPGKASRAAMVFGGSLTFNNDGAFITDPDGHMIELIKGDQSDNSCEAKVKKLEKELMELRAYMAGTFDHIVDIENASEDVKKIHAHVKKGLDNDIFNR